MIIAAPAVLKLPESWDLSVMPSALNQQLELLKSMLRQAEAIQVVAVDLTGIKRFDSCGLAALIELQRWAQANRCKLDWQGLTGNFQELAVVYGVFKGLTGASCNG